MESPAKAKTIEKFLGPDYKVMSSYGHIRDLKKKELSIDDKTLTPDYVIPKDKQEIVRKLRENAAAAGKVWLASDEDREGEAISWHLCEVLGLDRDETNRIVFHEITKPAILAAIKSPRRIDMNLVNAQQARRVLDRLVGFKLSPVLWRKVKPALSAGRVQSVAVRLIVEREREIHRFKSEPYYRVNAIFATTNADGSASEVKAELDTRRLRRRRRTGGTRLPRRWAGRTLRLRDGLALVLPAGRWGITVIHRSALPAGRRAASARCLRSARCARCASRGRAFLAGPGADRA